MRMLVVWLNNLPQSLQLFVSSISVAVPFYGAALLSYHVSRVAQLKSSFTLAVHAGIFVVFMASLVFAKRYASFVREGLDAERLQREEAIAHAHTLTERLTVNRLIELRKNEVTSSGFIEVFVVSVKRLNEIVEAAYASLEAGFGRSATGVDRIDFEVTFMAKSYKDGEITIPSYANREGRAPRSLIFRHTNKSIYGNTITAEVYREPRPSIHIIENTGDDSHYQEIYPGEKKRIQSTIIYPVLSDSNELLGTLVVHCDRAGFFKGSMEKYWTDFLEIFAKNLAVVKATMDKLCEVARRPGGDKIEIELSTELF